jgi:hypothetical protein
VTRHPWRVAAQEPRFLGGNDKSRTDATALPRIQAARSGGDFDGGVEIDLPQATARRDGPMARPWHWQPVVTQAADVQRDRLLDAAQGRVEGLARRDAASVGYSFAFFEQKSHTTQFVRFDSVYESKCHEPGGLEITTSSSATCNPGPQTLSAPGVGTYTVVVEPNRTNTCDITIAVTNP